MYWLVVGLGNPDAQYLLTRHNIGFMLIDAMVSDGRSVPWKHEHQSLVLKAKLDDTDVMFAKPQTYMNNSGQAVRALIDYYKIPVDQIIIVHDEVDIKFGTMRVHRDRSPGGHNGVKSITTHLGTQDYVRLRLGVGRPIHPGMDVADYVLQNFSREEFDKMGPFLERGADAIASIIEGGWSKAASRFNQDPKEEQP